MRLVQRLVAYIRKIFCMATKPAQQRYYAINHSMIWAWSKKQVIYAPLLRKRHNRELQLSSATNYGTLPGRIHFLLLVLYGLSNMVYCLLLDWKTVEKGALFAELRGRSGILATVNLIPLVVFASRNNLAIPILRVSFDTFNLFHRWIGRIVVAEAIVHVLAWMAAYIQAKGKDATPAVFNNNPFLQYGLAGLIAMLIMAFHSLSPLRHAFYETFLHIHQACAFLALLGIYVHLEMASLPAFPAIRAAVILFIFERLGRLGRLIYLNFSWKGGITTVFVEALPGDASRVTFQLPRHVKIRPGSHVYVYLPTVSLWMSHPFSVAWTNIESEPCTTRMAWEVPKTPNSLERQAVPSRLSQAPTSVSLVMVARTGMTRQLYQAARQQVGGKLHLRGFLEGPYAGHDSLTSYGTVVMFAGGGGITHHLVQIRHLLAGAQMQTVATRKIVLIWSIRDTVAMEWVKPWMTEILHMEGRREILKIVVYASRPSQPINVSKSKPTMQIVEGRLDPGSVLDEVIPTRIGAMMVSVCGPGALADEVRAAVRSRIHLANVDMNEESFTW
ncbi:ferric reductase like transmembrane component-domain-containing protein [Exophiala viscosa]|uniref:ferric reductase like transmembrane component-domain-containing protein n=1 Tax=Exophiala viscosa TaxID=2486360 RepID=UPI0021A17804|nr:ferric reductase like transmembrane component-domain-containing protein [Exophiala viscosa]